jgi:hypothetical protein
MEYNRCYFLSFTATQRNIILKLYTARVEWWSEQLCLVTTCFEGSNNNSNIQATISVGKSGSSEHQEVVLDHQG